MRPVPPDLLAKLHQKYQTIYNNADPRIFLVFQRTARYIEQGGIIEPITVEEEPPILGSWDLAMRREDRRTNPQYLYRARIEGGQVYVDRGDYLDLLTAMNMDPGTEEEPGKLEFEWEPVATIGSPGATDVAIEFDGYWVRTAKDAEVCFDSPARWTHITTGEPWVFWVDSAGALWVQQIGGSANQLAPNGVTKISAIRGWKSYILPHRDQGLIIGYIRAGALKYRNYAEQETAPPTWIWESEKDTGKAAVDVGLARTNDYRTAFLYETAAGEIHWLVTRRRWAGMGVPLETLKATIKNYELELISLMHTVVGDGPYPNNDKRHHKDKWRWGEYNNERIAAAITDYETKYLWAAGTEPVQIENIATAATQVGEDVGTGDGMETLFKLRYTPDPNSETIYVNGIEQTRGTDYTIDEKEITFATAPGDTLPITADYPFQNWGLRIKITFNHGVTNIEGQQAHFVVDDEALNVYPASATAAGDPWKDPAPPGSFDGSREVVLTCADFNNAINNGDTLNVLYAADPGRLQGEAGQDLAGFNEVFTPVNLQPDDLPAPGVEAIWNE